MRKTIYLPDDLAAQVEEYLKRHQGQTLSSLVQEALERKIAPPDLSGLLDLAGFVSVPPIEGDERQPEDQVVDDERRSSA
jgi:hypothetical protein